jgi:hypothetical protein
VSSTAPTVLWRLIRPGGGHARAVLLPGERPTVTFFVDDVLDRAENYDGDELALFRAEDVKRALLSEGWKEDA